MFVRRRMVGSRAGWRVIGAAAALFLGFFLITACGNNSDSPALPQTGRSGSEEQGMDPEGEEGHVDETAGADIGNGEVIYFTSTNEAGKRISYTEGPDFGGMMMGDYLTCASCHGPTGQGGRHVMQMQVMDAPAITYNALSSEEGEHAEEEEAEHGGEYSLEIFRSAVVDGEHPDGDEMDELMPRWNISDEDLRDLYAFLQNLQ